MAKYVFRGSFNDPIEPMLGWSFTLEGHFELANTGLSDEAAEDLAEAIKNLIPTFYSAPVDYNYAAHEEVVFTELS